MCQSIIPAKASFESATCVRRGWPLVKRPPVFRPVRIKRYRLRSSISDKWSKTLEAANFLPAAPDPQITLPTTTYKTKKPFPRNLLPADYFRVNRQHAHWPLVVMFVLTQLSVGAFIVGVVLDAAFDERLAATLRPLVGGERLGLRIACDHGERIPSWSSLLCLSSRVGIAPFVAESRNCGVRLVRRFGFRVCGHSIRCIAQCQRWRPYCCIERNSHRSVGASRRLAPRPFSARS